MNNVEVRAWRGHLWKKGLREDNSGASLRPVDCEGGLLRNEMA